MKKSTYGKCLLLLVLAWLCASCSLCSASQVQTSTNYKVIPTETWEELKQNHHLLELKLTEAKLQVQTLSKQSSELNLKLEEVEKQLVISMQELQNSKLSLESAKNLLSRTQTSLTELTEQINKEREKQRQIQDRLRLQRTFAYILLGLAVASK